MRIITARQFSRNASIIGTYLNTYPQDYIVVHNEIHTDKNFVCVAISAFKFVAGGKTKAELDDFQTQAIKERRDTSAKMGSAPKKKRKIALNDNEKRIEKVSSISDRVSCISSIGDFVSGYADLAR